ncbi:hypothetical protein [Nocardioides lijunqiniae]|uniref:hypothetical protein n=1 Tax=Nocardioides lijunqiniae TaxID=2760832 RepID=UPI0018780ED2|nr:hypothetical protein [Nocardioides lijunqiniae]
MDTTRSHAHRLWWTVPAVLALLGALVWALGAGGDPGRSPASATAPAPSPGSDPSSGPTGVPSPGSLQEVPVDEITPEPAIPLTATARLGQGLALRVVDVEDVEGVARGVGEIAGPALRITLELSNRSEDPVPVDSAVVDLLAGPDRTPAATLTGPGGRPLEGSVPAGDTVTGVYVFGVPDEDDTRVRLSVSYRSGAPVVVFAGDVA